MNPFGSKDPVWSSTPPRQQEAALQRAGIQQRQGSTSQLKPAQSLTTLCPPPAVGNMKHFSPQPGRRQSSDNPPRKATSTTGLYHGDDAGRADNMWLQHVPQTTTTVDVPSHYDVPKHALAAHKQSLPTQSHSKHKPPQKSNTLPSHSSSGSESYYDIPKLALAAVPESRKELPGTTRQPNGGHVARGMLDHTPKGRAESLYDVPKRATTLPHQQRESHYDVPKNLKQRWGKHNTGKSGQDSRNAAQPPSSTSRARNDKATNPPRSMPGNSTSLQNIPDIVGLAECSEHVYDVPPPELIQNIVANKSAKRATREGSRQKLLPNGNISQGRRSSSHYDIPNAEAYPATGFDGRQKMLSRSPGQKSSSSHKFFYV